LNESIAAVNDVQHTYRIRHQGIESTPFTIGDLRHMWQHGQIDNTTQFKRGDSQVWLDADDLRLELEYQPSFAPDPGGRTPDRLAHVTAQRMEPLRSSASLRVTSVRIPFREVFVLVVKFYAAALLIAGAIAAIAALILRFSH